MNAPPETIQRQNRPETRLLWIAIGIGLAVAVLLISMIARPGGGVSPSSAGGQSAGGQSAGAGPLVLSAADAARRAAIAKSGFIQHGDGTNAVDLYDQAMGLYNLLTAKEQQALRDWRQKLDPKSAAALYEKIQPIMDLLRNARGAGQADWQTALFYTRDGEALFPRMANSIGDLSGVAAWEADYRFQSDPAGAAGDLAAAEAMGRSALGSMVGLSNYLAVHGDDLEVLAENLTAANAGGISSSDLNYISSNAALSDGFRQSYSEDAGHLQSVLNEYANPDTQADAAQWIQDRLVNIFQSSTGSVAGTIPQIEWSVQAYAQAANVLQQPYDQAQQWWSAMQAQSAGMPVAKGIFGVYLWNQTETLEIENAMVNVAVQALSSQGQSASQPATDPVTGQAYTISQTPNGLVITSAFKGIDGKPVSVTFGPQVAP